MAALSSCIINLKLCAEVNFFLRMCLSGCQNGRGLKNARVEFVCVEFTFFWLRKKVYLDFVI